jgi:hypothetical protein
VNHHRFSARTIPIRSKGPLQSTCAPEASNAQRYQRRVVTCPRPRRLVLNSHNLQEVPGNWVDRRVRSRQKLRSVAYVDLGPSNGGLVLNLSEGGLAFSSALRLIATELPLLSFKLPGVSEAIEAQARIVWMSESRKEAGIQFERLLEDDARKISNWILGEQERNAQLREAALSPLAAPLLLEADLVAPETKDAAPPPLMNENVTRKLRRTAKSNPDKSALSHSNPEPIGPEPGPAVNHRRTLSVAVFVAIAFLASVAGLRIDHRLQPASSKPVNQPWPLQAKNDTNPATDVAQTVSDASLVQANAPANGAERSAAHAAASDAHQLASDSSLHTADLELARNKQGGAAADHAAITSEPEKSNSVSKLNQSSSSIGEPQKAERRTVTSSTSRVTTSQSNDAPGSASLLSSDARRLLEEAAAEKALEQAYASGASSPPSTPGSVGTTITPLLDRDGGATTPAAAAPAPPSGSVEIHIPSAPSARIPPEERSQALSEGRLQTGQLISRVQPVYSPDALSQELQGAVRAHVAINSDGEVEAVDATGLPLLVEAVTAALHQWHYKPTLLDGKAIPADEDVVVLFRLSTSRASLAQ